METKQQISDQIAANPAYRNIMERASVRRFSGQAVSDEIKEAILRAAMAAPSGVNRQPWELILVDSPELLSNLADALPYAKMAAKAPMAIAVCGNPARFLEGDDATLWVQDLSAVSENILLAAHALGLGGVWTCLYPHPDRMDAARRVLAVPEEIVPFSLIPVGYPAAEPHVMDKWQRCRLHRNGY